MKSLQIALVSAVFALFASQASAEDPYFKAPVDFNGTGCPNGTTTVTGENSPMLTVMFNQYDAAKPRDKARSKMERTACNFAVPVRVPAGYQVSLLTADWMGYAEGQTELFRRYTMMGISGGSPLPPQMSHPNGNFNIRDAKLYSSTTFSPCGKDVQLRINSSVAAKGPNSYISADTLDLQNRPLGKLIFRLNWQRCQ